MPAADSCSTLNFGDGISTFFASLFACLSQNPTIYSPTLHLVHIHILFRRLVLSLWFCYFRKRIGIPASLYQHHLYKNFYVRIRLFFSIFAAITHPTNALILCSSRLLETWRCGTYSSTCSSDCSFPSSVQRLLYYERIRSISIHHVSTTPI